MGGKILRPSPRDIIGILAEIPFIFNIFRFVFEGGFYRHKKNIADNLSPLLSGNILDLGCGTGIFSSCFSPDAYYGIDIDEKYIEYAQRNQRGIFKIADAVDLPFPDSFFDGILIIGVLHHVSNTIAERILAEAKRVLRDTGRMLVMEDVSSTGDNFIIRTLHMLDRGDFIRTSTDYDALVKKYFFITNTKKVMSGFCPYQVYVLDKTIHHPS